MRRRLPLAALALAACGAPALRPPPPATPAVTTALAPAGPTDLTLTVVYREAASVFEILDNVSDWLPGKCDTEYREAWKKRFEISAADEGTFTAYQALRKHYYPRQPPPADGDVPGLFAPRKLPDRVAEAFYASATLDEAFTRLAAFMPPDDVAALRRFYAHHRPHYEVLLQESRGYPDLARNLQQKLDAAGVAAHYQRVARFYGVTGAAQFTALYVWWPPVEAVTANLRGSFLLLKYHPEKHREGALRDVDVPVHEMMHFISSQAPEAQKQALSRLFLAGCDVGARLPGPRILEEPLAVVHQKMFLAQVDPERLDFSGSWYGDPWTSTLAKLLYAPVSRVHARGGRLDEVLVKQASKACAHLVAVAALLQPKPRDGEAPRSR
jgi:hypothetical protein